MAAAERKARPFAKESSILQRKEVPHLRYTCKFLCMRKKKKKTPAAVPLVATFAGRLLI